MPTRSAGIIPYRRRDGVLEVLLVHPGGPFYIKKDLGVWSVSKGLVEEEEALGAALREIEEETGYRPSGDFLPLQPLRQPSGKVVEAWAVEGDWDPSTLHSNEFTLEWPRGSGQTRSFPEVDRAEWFHFPEAARRILPGQRGFLEELHLHLTGSPLDRA